MTPNRKEKYKMTPIEKKYKMTPMGEKNTK
jgi:hypothetical protein